LFAISLSKKVATNESTLFCERSFLIDTNRAANNIAIYVFIVRREDSFLIVLQRKDFEDDFSEGSS
jgi:hypothetical protein